jgi:hypothetical protein
MDARGVDGAGGTTNEKIIISRMAIIKGKANAGQGGKIGHSNQDHWGPTEEVKDAARKWRRLEAKVEIASSLTELAIDNAEQSDSDRSDEFSQ